VLWIEFGFLRQKADADARLRPRFAVDVAVHASHDRSNEDFPEPFNPSTPILAPGKNDRLMSRRMVRFGGTTLDTRLMV